MSEDDVETHTTDEPDVTEHDEDTEDHSDDPDDEGKPLEARGADDEDTLVQQGPPPEFTDAAEPDGAQW